MYARVLNPLNSSFFLLGPRGTGKTTWLRHHYQDARWIDLLDEALFQDLLSNPRLFGQLLGSVPDESWVVVDEVQRLPNILNEVHRLIEARRLRFALTGSSARKLRRGGVNLLAGRASWRAMYPLTPHELGEDFVLERALEHGTIPLVWTAPDPMETLAAYVRLYLKEEIQAEAIVRNLPGFARFLPVSALFHGQVLNIASLARDAGVARSTVQGYLDILEDTLMACRVRAFEGRLRVRERRHPKFYWMDSGLVRALKRAKGPVATEERGALLEGFVFTLLAAQRDYVGGIDDIFYWAPATGNLEVDFLVASANGFVAIEVKSSVRIRPEHLRGLRAIGDLQGLTRRLVVYLGEQHLTTDDGIEAVSFSAFCGMLSGLFGEA